MSNVKTKFPELFSNRCEVSTGPGWDKIIDALCSLINSHSRSARSTKARILLKLRSKQKLYDWEKDILESKPAKVKIVQVKEKFGGLRFYCDGADEFIYGAIAFAESMSVMTCESCGQPGTLRNDNWIKCKCDKCI